LVTGTRVVLSYWLIGLDNLTAALTLVRSWFILAVLIVVFMIDLEHYLILDRVLWPASLAVLVGNALLDWLNGHNWLSASSLTASGAFAALTAAGFFYLLWLVSRGRWIGMGDVKFAVFLGFAAGLPGVLISLFLAFMLGAAVSIWLLASKQKELKSPIPFGTFLALGSALTLLFGVHFWAWYRSLILG
jgi:prepilin signal peptidase PulO-like enzyme (type II secretory pathway)